MAEGILRPTIKESVHAYSRRLAAADPRPDRFELAKLLAELLVEEFRGFNLDPLKAFQVHVRGEGLAIRCLNERAHGWSLAQTLARKGFGGRGVSLEKGWEKA